MLKNPLKIQPALPTVAWCYLSRNVKKRIFTPAQYALYTPKFIGLSKNTYFFMSMINDVIPVSIALVKVTKKGLP
jgi:hypothetical protein